MLMTSDSEAKRAIHPSGKTAPSMPTPPPMAALISVPTHAACAAALAGAHIGPDHHHQRIGVPKGPDAATELDRQEGSGG